MENKRIPADLQFIYGLTAIVLMVIEFFLLYLLHNQEMSLFMAAFIHSILSILLAAWCWLMQLKKQDLRLPLSLWLMVTTMGAFGSGLVVCCIMLYAIYNHTATSFTEWFASIFPDTGSVEESIYERLKFGWEDFSEKHGVVPFKDVMLLGSEQQKRLALAKIARHFKPEFAPALRIALASPSNPIRVQAAAIIARLEQDFSRVILHMEHSLEQRTNDPELLHQIGERCDAYAYSGLLDRLREQEFRRKAIQYFERFLAIRQGEQDALFALGRLYLRDGKPLKAYQSLKVIILAQRHPSSHIIPWMMECLYKLKRYGELKNFAETNYSRIDPQDPRQLRTLETAKLWAEGLSSSAMSLAS